MMIITRPVMTGTMLPTTPKSQISHEAGSSIKSSVTNTAPCGHHLEHTHTHTHFIIKPSQFIAENSPPKLRGALTGFIEVAITLGIIYGYGVGMWLYETFPTGYSWKYTFKFATIFGVGMFFGMLYLPESPRWLVSAGRPLYEALEAAQFVNSDLTSEEIVNMKKEIERQVPTHLREGAGHESAARRLFCSAQMRIPMIVGMGLIIGQQVTGLPAMLYYCVDVFEAVRQLLWVQCLMGSVLVWGPEYPYVPTSSSSLI